MADESSNSPGPSELAAAVGSPPPEEKKTPVYKNPFVIAFVVGIVFLTVIPLLQRKFLKAPPPIAVLPEWSLQTRDGKPFGSAQLRGQLAIVSVTPAVCDSACLTRITGDEGMLRHLDEPGAPINLVVVSTGEQPPNPDQLHLIHLHGEPAAVESLVGTGFRTAFLKFVALNAIGTFDAGTTTDEYAHLPSLVLLDQEGAIRGFWQDTVEGRGNAINAALLLSKYGPRP